MNAKGLYKYIVVVFVFLVELNGVCAQQFDFEYREPYFFEVNTPEFSKEFQTHRLDDEWGIWGHNLDRIVAATEHSDAVYSMVDGVRNKKQFCFSSNELKQIILDFVLLADKANFTIAPQDNSLVCQCHQCVLKGNTAKDAGPSVFTLLKEVAIKNPLKKFYTLLYSSVRKIPDLEYPKNVGVFYSTINYQHGIPYQKLSNVQDLIQELNTSTSKLEKCIVWDYALNFDGYLEFYPSLLNIQQNLVFLKEKGITGVFYNGSESYALFQELRATVLAKLLQNIKLDVKQEITKYFQVNYPKEIASLITPYYLSLEETFVNSEYRQGIYSNILSAQRKYLKAIDFINFYDRFNEVYQKLKAPNKKVQQLLVALDFMKLELISINGIGGLEKSSKKDIVNILERLKLMASINGINYINERYHTLSNYIKQWYYLLLKPTVVNQLTANSLKVLSALDEDYSNIGMLTDGCFGFLNYNTNWMLFSQEDLKLEIDLEESSFSKKELVISLLNNPSCHVYFPEKIFITSSGVRRCIEVIEERTKDDKMQVKINTNGLTTPVILEMERKYRKGRNIMACDEIILKQ